MKIFDVNTPVIAADCLMMFGVCDVVEAVARRKDRFVKRFVLNSNVVCEICTICSYFSIYLISYICCAADFGE